jgi:nitrogen fixation protein NifU and related proteins
MQHSLYKEELLEHYHSPLNFGVLDSADVSARQLNPFCGDDIEMFIKISKNTVTDIAFRGKGCAISIAAASLLTEEVKHKSVDRLTKLAESDMLDLLGIEVSETRKKCALLPLSVLKDCLNHYAV